MKTLDPNHIIEQICEMQRANLSTAWTGITDYNQTEYLQFQHYIQYVSREISQARPQNVTD